MFRAKHAMLTSNNAIIGVLVNVNLVAITLVFNYYRPIDFFLFCVPHLILVNMAAMCISCVVFKTNAYAFILSTELWLKTKRFNTSLVLLNQIQNQHKFSTYFIKSFQWFIYLLTLNKDYNQFWIWQFSILIIWRSMIITFLSYIIFFYELPLVVFIMYTLMWASEQIIFFLLLIQVTNVVGPLNKSSKALKSICFHKNVPNLSTRLKVDLSLQNILSFMLI